MARVSWFKPPLLMLLMAASTALAVEDRAHVHDGATASGLHAAGHGLSDQEGPAQVDAQHRIKIVFRNFQERGGSEDARIADKYINEL